MKVGIAQINTTVGDISGNCMKILQAYRHLSDAGAEIVVCPEMAITGYPPRDLLLKRAFVDQNIAALERLTEGTGNAGLLVGYAGWSAHRPGRDLMNCAALLQNGFIMATRAKSLLPTYDVFDEDRYFEPARKNTPIEFNNQLIGVTICEDIWNDDVNEVSGRYDRNPAQELVDAGATILFNLSASPWCVGKQGIRHDLLLRHSRRLRIPIVYCNLVGGNDELVFDGASVVLNARSVVVGAGKMFQEDALVVDSESSEGCGFPAMGDEEKIFRGLALGVRDYIQKCGFRQAVLGLSGGIDSAVTACVAVEALGPENVLGVAMPSKFSSQGSLDDARVLAEKLGIRYEIIPIQSAFDLVKGQLAPIFTGRAEDATEENIQARLRGVLLMALSNKFGSLLLTTGNKSELAVGYCTLYGDMCGGLAVISDVPKTMIYRVARWITATRGWIPMTSILKAPSAELRPNQTDQDSLPPYEILDAIIEAYVVEGKTAAEIIAAGFDEATVKKTVGLIDRNEYKRRQAAPGLKVTTKAFGVGRRIPVAQRYRET